METQIKKLDYEAVDMDIIEEAGRVLKEGGLVAFPTETVYGLGGDALNPASSEKIYAAKGRPSDNPLIVHIAAKDDVYRIAKEIPKKAERLMETFWPGPLTIILKRRPCVPDVVTAGLDTVGMRCPDHPVTRAVIAAAGTPVAAPSGNTSGRPSPTTAQHVEEDLAGRIDMIVDGGAVEIGVESTILDMTVEPPMILRPGAVTREMLEEVIGEVAVDKTLLDSVSHTAPKAPGMKYRHYAPKAELTVVEGENDQVMCVIDRLAREKIAGGFKVGIIAAEDTAGRYGTGEVKCIGARGDEAAIASHLYGILREFDSIGTDYIYSEAFGREGIGTAVMNRLLKAAGQRVIDAGDFTGRREKNV